MEWQANDPNVQNKVRNSQTEQVWIRYATVMRSGNSTRPERGEMRAALQCSQDQECHGPKCHDNDGGKSDGMKSGLIAQDVKDATEEE